jgi:hypothetical protein
MSFFMAAPYSAFAPCPGGWIANGPYCYRVFNNARTAYEAQLACFSMNSKLAEFNDQAEFDFVNDVVISNKYGNGVVSIWVDMNK